MGKDVQENKAADKIRIKAADGSGSFSAYISYPEGDLQAPAVIVIQEIFGVNENMRAVCQNLSHAGYIAVCPDLFWRQEPGIQLTDQSKADWAKAMRFFQGFDVDKGVEDLKSTLAQLRKNARCSGKAGTLGFCLGGKLACLMATRSDADCSVSYYGVGIEEMLGEAQKIRKPLLMHVAAKDKFVPLEVQAKILHALKGNEHVEIRVYPEVDHAFARIGGEHYDKEAARQANYLTADFLATHLGTETI